MVYRIFPKKKLMLIPFENAFGRQKDTDTAHGTVQILCEISNNII